MDPTARYGGGAVGPRSARVGGLGTKGCWVGYEPLPIVEVDVDDLRLDLDNYRIPTRRDDEEAALKYLFASEDVLGNA